MNVYSFCAFVSVPFTVNKAKMKTADAEGVGESGGGSVFFDFFSVAFSRINVP